MRQLSLFELEEELTGIEEDAPEAVQNAWREAKKDMKRNFSELQALPYEDKIKRQTEKAYEFYEEIQKRGCEAHVSVGGLDSITLFIWLHSIGIHVPAISVSAVEDKGNQKVHKALGIELVKSYKTKVEVLNECGFPVISKRIAGKIDLLQNPTEDNKTVRHAIITGECGEQGGQREEALVEHGCNYYGATVTRSAPFAIFMRNDVLRLALEMDDWYHSHIDLFTELYYQQPYSRDKDGNVIPYAPLETIIPSAYGEIKQHENGDYYTTRAQRTGCSMCGFGIHIEDRPHRFDRLREDNPGEWEFYMKKCVTDPVTGEKYGWGKVLDYIGIEWEDVPAVQMELPIDQMM